MNNEEQNNNVQKGLENIEPVNQENVPPVENNIKLNMPEQQVQSVQYVENSNNKEVVPPVNGVKKQNVGLIVALVILGVLILVGLVLGILWFLKVNNTQNVYYQAIDNLANNAVTNINKVEEELNKPLGLNANISANMTTSDSSMKTVASLLNKMKINMNMEMDFNSKVSNMTYDIKYDNDSLIEADLVLNNQSAFLNLNSLYNKSIKLPEDSELDSLWQAYDFESYKTIVKEMATIIKASLKEEYFTKKDAKINKVNTKVYVLTLNSKDIYNLQIDILNNIINDEKLINALSTIGGSDVKKSLENIKENVTEGKDTFISEVYINKSTKKLEKINIKINDGVLELNKTENDKFDIVLNNNDNKVVIGYIIMNDTNFTLSLKDTGVDITMETQIDGNTEKVNLNFEAYGTYIKLNLERKDDKGKVGMTISDDNNNKLTLNVDYTMSSISKVTSKNISNYIELDKMTDNDYNTIMQNLYQNRTFINIMQKLLNQSMGQLNQYNLSTT